MTIEIGIRIEAAAATPLELAATAESSGLDLVVVAPARAGDEAPLDPWTTAAWLADAEKMLGRDVDFTRMYTYFDTFWETEKAAE